MLKTVVGAVLVVCCAFSSEAAKSAPVVVRVRGDGEVNLLRNGGFEFGNRYNGMKTLLTQGDFLGFMWSGQRKTFADVGLENWWAKGLDATLFEKVAGYSGKRALAIKAPGELTSGCIREIGKGGYPAAGLTLSFRYRTTPGAKAFACVYGTGSQLGAEGRHGGEPVVLEPKDEWTYFSRCWPKTGNLPACEVAFKVDAGTLTLDEVQLEVGAKATAFRETSGHWLEFADPNFGKTELPAYDQVKEGTRRFFIRNTSGRALTGRLDVYLDKWYEPKKTKIRSFDLKDFAPNGTLAVDYDAARLTPDGWIALAELGMDVRADGVFDPTNTGAGTVGYSMLSGRNGMRMAIFKPTPPEKIFGVGNGMIEHPDFWAGKELSNELEARELPLVGVGQADTYKAAIIGCKSFNDYHLDFAEPGLDETAYNPVDRRYLDVCSPAGRAELKRRARELGEKLGRNAGIAATKLANEMFYANSGKFCPSAAADADFRAWAKARYGGDLARANRAWKTSFRIWDDVKQIISDLGAGTFERTGAAAIDWTHVAGAMTDETKARLKAFPAFALDWYRWRVFVAARMYNEFTHEARRYDRKTLYGNNYPWPNYFLGIVWPQWRGEGVPQLDVQYACGYSVDLGTNEEMIDILEQAESIARGKPILGREVYVQPTFPAEATALQNWGMVAHGMTLNLVFAWKPYSDHGDGQFRENGKYITGAWLKKEAKPMWMLIDTDGSRLPAFNPNFRSAREIERYNQKFDGVAMKRIPGDTGIYYPRDTTIWNSCMTFDACWTTRFATDRCAIAATLRYAGARIEYYDEENIGNLGKDGIRTLVVPPSPLVSVKGVKAIEKFLARGGKVVVFEPFGTIDPETLEKKPGVKLRVGRDGAPSPSAVTYIPEGAFPGKYSAHPHFTAEYDTWTEKFLAEAPIERHAWWENDEPRQEGEDKLKPGEGRPVVEVVVRRHAQNGRRVAIVLNKGGAGKGRLCGPDFKGVQLVDVLTGRESSLAFELPALGYRVFELQHL